MLKNVLCMILALSLLAVFPVMAAAKDTASIENFKTFDDVIQFLNDKYNTTLQHMRKGLPKNCRPSMKQKNLIF